MDRSPKNLPRNCTFSREDWKVLAACWHPIAYGDAITDQPQSLKLLDEELEVYRTAKGVVVAKDLCIHRAPNFLSAGWTWMNWCAPTTDFATVSRANAPGCRRIRPCLSRKSYV